MARKSGGAGKTAGYILLGMLLLGLGGFGATNFGGAVSSIGAVGETEISAQDYFRNIRSEINAVQAQTGQPLTFIQARAQGIPDAVLSRMVISAAMQNEAAQMGLSVGDDRVAQDIREIPAFQGVDGQFNRENYRLALENAGFTERQFEENLRAESAASLLQSAVQGGIKLPDTYINALISYAGERRAVTWAEVGTGTGFDEGLPSPTDDELRAFFEANIADYTRPETKQITYAWLTPAMIVGTVEVEEDLLRKAYEERKAEFNMPERRLVERLVMPNEAVAQDAAERIAAGTVTFEDVVAERELDLADIDLGDVTRDDLGDAGEAVFSANIGDVVQAPSNLGPSLFRVNAVLEAQNTSFEDAQADLRDVLALDKARRVIAGQMTVFDEELAAGVTLEELAETTDLQLGQIGWTGDNAEDIAGYEAFAAKANEAAAEDYPEIAELGDGGLFALRVDEVQAPAPYVFDDVKDRVQAAWEQNARQEARASQAEELKTQLTGDTTFESLGLTPRSQPNLTRTSFGAQLPPDALTAIFTMQPGDVTVLKGNGSAWLLRLDEIIAADLNDEAAGQMRQFFAAQADQDLAQDVYRAVALDIQARAGVTIDQAAVNAVHANFQ
ncbi:peptidyl-prolyl cis-trans isomerase [Sagittula sp. S175]|uniref:peptidylprolyl isomerase n=1 Tax=Sagittula sp. S175 TaxID=3415129 RepID=UPI003C7EC645